jgi:hypothetical protein
MRDGNGHWMLVFAGGDNSVRIESPAFGRITEVHAAAARMRAWLGRRDLVAFENLPA